MDAGKVDQPRRQQYFAHLNINPAEFPELAKISDSALCLAMGAQISVGMIYMNCLEDNLSDMSGVAEEAIKKQIAGRQCLDPTDLQKVIAVIQHPKPGEGSNKTVYMAKYANPAEFLRTTLTTYAALKERGQKRSRRSIPS